MILLYILKSSACLTLFLLFYKFFLEKENFHVFKRFFLLNIVLASFIIPLITFNNYIETPLEILGPGRVGLDSNMTFKYIQESTYNFSSFILIVYCSGVLIIGFKFLKNLTHLLRKVTLNPIHKQNDFTIVLLKEEIAPYSFLNYIFFSEEKYVTNKIPQEVLLHEKAHVKQKHSIDIIFIEIIQIFFWFNPILYATKKAIKLNHEFLADNAVLKKGIDLKKYQNSLLNYFTNPQQQQLVSSFNYTLIAKRFLIMNKELNRRRLYLKISIIAPLFTVLLSCFSNKVIVQIPHETSIDSKERIETDVDMDVSVPEGFATSAIIDLVNNGAVFEYQGKQISNEKAISIAEITDFNVHRNKDSNKLIVYLSEN